MQFLERNASQPQSGSPQMEREFRASPLRLFAVKLGVIRAQKRFHVRRPFLKVTKTFLLFPDAPRTSGRPAGSTHLRP